MKKLSEMDIAELLDVLEYARDPNAIRDELIKRRARAGRESLGEYLHEVRRAPSFNFHQHLLEQRAWSEKTFGPGYLCKGFIDHVRKELVEIEQDPNDLEEWIDVVILALDACWRIGASPSQIIGALQDKTAKNRARKWPDWRTRTNDKAIEHVRDLEVPEELL